MKREVSKGLAQRPYARHWLPMLGLALTLASFGIAGEAQAQCLANGFPSTSASNSTVVCSGAVTDPATGYGSIADDNNTYTISGSLTGGSFGLRTGLGGTLTNNGTITGTNSVGVKGNLSSLDNSLLAIIQGFNGVSAGNISVSNAGLIQSTGASSDALRATNLNLTNTGGIRGVTAGIFLDGDATINNTNVIQATGVTGAGIRVTKDNAIVNASGNAGPNGFIIGVASGIDVVSTNATITNGTGTILGASAIHAAAAVTVTNNGAITGDVAGIDALTANVTNSATGTIRADGANGVAIHGTNLVTLNNAHDILAIGLSGIAVSSNGTINIVSNSGTISAAGANGMAVNGGGSGAINISANTGTISAA